MSGKETRRSKGGAIWEHLADGVCKYSISDTCGGKTIGIERSRYLERKRGGSKARAIWVHLADGRYW